MGNNRERLQHVRRRLADGLHLKEIAPEVGLKLSGLRTCLYREIHRCGYATSLQWVVEGIRNGEMK